MVRQPTATAVRASISTPVWPVTFTVARTTRPGNLRSGSISTAMLETGRGWQSGISSCVRFAAMMAAMRAAPSTSPFLALPASTRSRVFAVITTRPRAMATRSVAALADTSTMRASPRRPRWLSLEATASLRGTQRSRITVLRLANERARGRLDVALAHEALAHEEGRNADGDKLVQIGGRENPALANGDATWRNSRRQAPAGGERGLERLEIAVVDSDEPRAQAQSTLELSLVVYFQQDIHAERGGAGFQVPRHLVVDRGHDNQDAVRGPGPRLRDLIRVVHEVLAQNGQIGRGTSGDEVVRLALERRAVGQHRQAGGAAPRVGAPQRRRIKIRADQPSRWACFLDLGDQSVAAGREFAFDGAEEATRRRDRFGLGLDRGERASALRGRDLFALVGLDLGENIGHRDHLPSDALINRCRRLSASPESIDFCASATACLRSAARPATTRPAAALRIETSRNGPLRPLSTSMSAWAFSFASPPRRASGLTRCSPTSSGVISKVRTAPRSSAAT